MNNWLYNLSFLLLLVLTFLLICSHASGQQPTFGNISPELLVNQINANRNSTFQARLYPRFAHIGKLPKFSNNILKKPLKQTNQFVSRNWPVPPTYDSRQVWPQCIGGIQDEGDCGAVWAMIPTATISDRMCVKTETKFQERLSTQYILNCDQNDQGCNGGELDSEFIFQIQFGTPTETCYPYVGNNQTLPTCPKWCVNGDSLTLYKIRSVYNISGEYNMQQEILQWGSVMSMIDIYQDFFYYSKGVYQHGKNLKPYDHYLVRIIGWGILDGVKYWIVPNNMGTKWGMNGYIYILRGVNEIGIEQNGYGFNI